MTKEGGVYTVPCKVNGLKLRFIFDTGASKVSISLTEAIFMVKNGYLNPDDIYGTTYARLADGYITENTEILLREIEIGGLKLYNIRASVMHELAAPLLLGQTAIEKLGAIQLEGNKLIILTKGNKSYYDYSDQKKSTFKPSFGTSKYMDSREGIESPELKDFEAFIVFKSDRSNYDFIFIMGISPLNLENFSFKKRIAFKLLNISGAEMPNAVWIHAVDNQSLKSLNFNSVYLGANERGCHSLETEGQVLSCLAYTAYKLIKPGRGDSVWANGALIYWYKETHWFSEDEWVMESLDPKDAFLP